MDAYRGQILRAPGVEGDVIRHDVDGGVHLAVREQKKVGGRADCCWAGAGDDAGPSWAGSG